jgi:2'-5' RNA ligase
VTDARVDSVLAALREPLSVSPFTMRIGGAGAFPPSGPPRAIWLGLSEGREGLIAAYQQLAPRLTALGFEQEKRPYSPHLTIARVKDCRPAEGKAIRRALEAMHDSVGESEIRFATLFRSRTGPAGSQYEALLRTPLTAG